MYHLFPRPDLYLARSGALDAVISEQIISGAPTFLRGLRALFVSDVHVLPHTTQAHLETLLEQMARVAPDLLLLGGDYGDRAEDAARLFHALKSMKPSLGCFGVLGNNDAEAWAGRLDELRSIMEKAGCRLLVNASTRLAYNGGTLWIGGVDEHKLGRPDASKLYPEISGPNEYRILMSHYPIAPCLKPDLMLSGHTHGGQFNLLGVTPFAVGFERIRRRPLVSMAVSGLHEIDGMKLLVSKGIGASRLQLRAGVRPEMNLLRFD